MTSGLMDTIQTWMAPTQPTGEVTITQSIPSEATPVINPTPDSLTSQTMPTPSVEPSVAPTVAPPDLEPTSETTLRNAVEAWRKAWQTRDLPAYLDLYGANFVPPLGANRQAWEDTRRARIGSKQKIELSLKNLTLQMQGNTATVKFTQVYADERVSMANRKTLVWQLAEGRWLIQSETTD